MINLFDTHQHLIYRDQAVYGWTSGIPALAEGDFSIADYQQLTADKGVGGTLFMEAGVEDSDYQPELRHIAGLAKDQASNIRGLIASIRPEEDAGFEAWLEESIALGAIGYRRILHVVDDALSQADNFRVNVRRIGAANKTFDICFLAGQLAIGLELAKACDNTTLVLNHCGVPDIANNGLDPWRADIKALAALPNVYCKLSGIMAYCAPDNSTYEAIEPFVDHVLEVFGPARMVWGSDWPVVNLGKGLPEWIEVTRQILAKLTEDEAQQIAFRTAEEVYKVKLA